MDVPLVLRTGSYVGMLAVMLGFEWRTPYYTAGHNKIFRVCFHLGISVANSVALYLIFGGILAATLTLAQRRHLGLSHLLGLYGPLELIASLILLDFCTYGLHWLYHRNRFLWRFHRAHHSDTELDVTTASRFHPGELIISGAARCLLILIWGPSLESLVVFDILLNLAAQFHHSNVGIPMSVQDWLEKAVVTPRMHRCHHALHQTCFNTNFAAILSCWDRLGRTYHHSRQSGELEAIGLTHPRGPETMQLKAFLMSPLQT
jgi:sterol desaturase/sphingolipid hydroxylase (fatty acid hydroxylase superfamily)